MNGLLTASLVLAIGAMAACAAGTQGRSALARLLARDATEARIEYVVHLDEPQTQYVGVSMVVRGVAAETVDVALPVWRPGRYDVLDMAGTLHGVEARTGTPSGGYGRSLDVEKIDKSTWRVACAGADEFTFSYTIYANSLADRTRHVDASHAFLSGAAVFTYIEARRDEPVLVRVEAPEGWRVATGLSPAGDDPMVLRAASYDVLVDSPLEIGTHDLLTFEVEGVPHEIAVWGGWNREAYAEKVREDFARIVRAERDVFGDLPYERYVYLLHVLPSGGGGTEHLNSTIMQTSAGSFRSASAYRRFLGLVSHEMFHTWNVKRLRPAGLSPYDYARENYTDLLWVAEGTTDYYDSLILVRAGISKPQDYLDALAGQIGGLRSRPGARVQTLAESSFDAWIKFSHSTPDSVNTTVSFYDKGGLASLVLDLEMRRRSEGRASLDTLMRDLYLAFPLGGPGFTEADLRATAERLCGTSVGDVLDRCVHSTEDIDFESAFEAVGLRLAQEADRPGEGEEGASERAYLGFTLEDRGGIVAVASVLADGPAWGAGLNTGDEVLAINGVRARGTDPAALFDSLRPGDAMAMLVARRGEVRTIEFAAGARPSTRWTISRIESATDRQRSAYASWLGQPWPDEGEGRGGAEAREAVEAGEAGEAIGRLLDAWHAAAARADAGAYFGALSEDSVFMGTDATERWTKEAFRAFAEPYFAKGKAWTFEPRDRTIDVAEGWAWFDELLDSEHLGVCRGSGVARRSGEGGWEIVQYNLSIPIPNPLADEFVGRIRSHGKEEP